MVQGIQYFVIVFIELMTLIIGFYLGINYLKQNKFNTNNVGNTSFHSLGDINDLRRSTESIKSLKPPYKMSLCELEIRVLNKLLDEDLTTISDFNEIIRVTHLSKENQRQRRHLFIKELNLKLSVLNGYKENIERIDEYNDKRLKLYRLSNYLEKEMLLDYIKNI